jgi:hypothetical protein
MSYEVMNVSEGRELIDRLDKALARFMFDADQDNEGDNRWNIELRHFVELCDRLSHKIEEAREHFADDYRLIEVTVKTTHNVWVKGGDDEHAKAAAADYLMQNLATDCGGDEHLAAWVDDCDTLEKRSGTDWETGQTADIEI